VPKVKEDELELRVGHQVPWLDKRGLAGGTVNVSAFDIEWDNIRCSGSRSERDIRVHQ